MHGVCSSRSTGRKPCPVRAVDCLAAQLCKHRTQTVQELLPFCLLALLFLPSKHNEGSTTAPNTVPRNLGWWIQSDFCSLQKRQSSSLWDLIKASWPSLSFCVASICAAKPSKLACRLRRRHRDAFKIGRCARIQRGYKLVSLALTDSACAAPCGVGLKLEPPAPSPLAARGISCACSEMHHGR